MLKKLSLTLVASLMLTVLSQLFVFSSAQAATTGSIIYSNSAEPEPYYSRAVKLSNENVLATFTRKFPGNTGWVGMEPFDFYRSTDNGLTWSSFSQIDPNNYGLDPLSNAAGISLENYNFRTIYEAYERLAVYQLDFNDT